MENNFNEILKGFFWGIGFVVAVIGGGTVYTLTIAADVNGAFKKLAENEAISSTSEFENDFEIVLSDIFKENGQVRITAELKNITKKDVYTPTVVASTFDNAGRFIGNCQGKGNEITLSPNEVSYVDIVCTLYASQAKRVSSTKLKIKWI